MDDLIETMASALQRFSTGARRAAGAHGRSRSTSDAFFGLMPAFVRARRREPANFGAAGPRPTRPSARQARRRAPRSARSSSPSSAATPRAGCPRTSRRSCCSIRKPARCWRCSTAATSPRRARPRCRRCRRAARAQDGGVARDHRIGRPGAEPPGGAVARPPAAAGDGLESEQTAPRPVRRGGKLPQTVRRTTGLTGRQTAGHHARSTTPARRSSAPTSSSSSPRRRRR